MKRITTILFLFLFLGFFGASEVASAANHYVRDGATGSANGNDWTNAWTAIPSTLTRGDTYYIADGNYGSYLFNTPEAGNAIITIKKATVSSHGTNSGWSDSYGDGQAVFGNSRYIQSYWNFSGVVFRTSYWNFDGVVGAGNNKLAYGFTFAKDTSGADERYLQISDAQTRDFYDILLSHISIECTGSQTHSEIGLAVHSQANVMNSTLSYFFIDNCQVLAYPMGSGWIFENGYFGRQWSTGAHHGVPVQDSYASGSTFRYNIFKKCSYICIEGENGGKIYGNIFDPHFDTSGRIVSGSGGMSVYNTSIYNNTVVDAPLTTILSQVSGSGNIVKNNLFYNSTGNLSQESGGVIDHDYNAYFSCTDIPSEANSQVSSSNPFVNLITEDYHLNTSTDAGMVLSSPYDIDSDNNIRGTDSVWDRGAYEYVGAVSDTTPPATPSGLSVQ